MATTLIAFPPSLDCELTRFLLTHYETPYTEERHALLFCPFVTLQRGRTILFPLLLNGPERLSTARAVVEAFDPRASLESRLLRDGTEGQQVERDWSDFNQTLAFASAIFGYYHLLKHRDIMLRPLSDRAPERERRSVERAYPLHANTLRLLLRLTPTRARAALDRARSVADRVDRRLVDQRPYLVGDRFSLSDMAFAVALAPLVLPDEYGGALPTLAEMPTPVRSAIDEMRARPSGQFALRMYRTRRHGRELPTASAQPKRVPSNAR